ncbi:hypothetical protein P0D69_43920 [Paraburkholderia sediminicola]|uniref:hypothetical protein n=1 Tax=Paraburkholderia sediminicola TaxID=458836 RepID=UPI0038BA82AE
MSLSPAYPASTLRGASENRGDREDSLLVFTAFDTAGIREMKKDGFGTVCREPLELASSKARFSSCQAMKQWAAFSRAIRRGLRGDRSAPGRG